MDGVIGENIWRYPMTKHFDDYFTCLEKRHYFQAHEALEAIWFPRRFADNSEMKLLKGFINAAVSFELVKRGRKEAAKRVWKNYEKYVVLLDGIHSEHTPTYKKMKHYVEARYKMYHYNRDKGVS